jgi:CO/xanthine dehydrogenase Mo-binding subunit
MADIEGVNGQRETFNVVGKPNLPGKLSRALATGTAKFGIDYTAPDMLFAKFLRCPHGYATIKSIDASGAKAIPGVVDVILWDDPELAALGGGGRGGGGGMAKPKAKAKPSEPAPDGDKSQATPESVTAGAAAKVGGGEAKPAFGPPAAGVDGAPKPKAGAAAKPAGGMMGMGGGAPAGYISNVADMETQEVGAIVVAESLDLCDEALRALKVDWDVHPANIDLGAARKVEGHVTMANKIDGDVEAGFKEADQIVEFDFNMQSYCGHIPNPSGSIAWWFDDPYTDGGQSLHIEGAVQLKDQVGGMYRLSADKVVQEGLFQGGKYCDWGIRKTQNVTPFLAKRYGRPVRMVCTREEMYDFNLNQRFMHLKVGYKGDGRITAVEDYSVADNGVPGSSSFGTSGDQGYGPWYTTKCKNIKQVMEVVTTNRGKMYLSGQHCPFNWDNMTMAQQVIADKLGKDPIDIMTLNLHGPKSQDDTEMPISYKVCVDAAKKAMNWQWHAAGAKKLPDGRMHGLSFRYQMCPRHAFSGYTCKLELRNGVVHMPTKGPCTGIYAVEGNAMVVAEELGLKYEDVSIDFDYRETFTPVGGGSDGTTASAWAMKECANILKQKILEAAIRTAAAPPAAGGFGGFGPPPQPLPFKDMKPEDLDLVGGNVVVKADPSKSAPLARAVGSENIFATYSGRPPAAIWGQMGKALDTMNVAMCEVAVDTETGEVEILKWVVAADPGKIIRRTSLESQIDQVMFFSGGCQLSEEYIYDKATGVMLDRNMFEYKKPTILDFAPVHKELLETRVGNAAYGSNGISHSLANTHLAVCAIQNAIGKWVDPPATPDKILKALGKA